MTQLQNQTPQGGRPFYAHQKYFTWRNEKLEHAKLDMQLKRPDRSGNTLG
jgi:hypothetical protein